MRQKRAVKRVTTDLANSVLTGDCFEQRLFSVGRAILVFAFVGALQACAAPERLSAVPKGQLSDASVPGVPEARLHYDVDAEPFERLGLESVRREKAYLEEQGQAGALPPAHFLVISGGGDNGAFGAGLLVGWTKAGDRPEFKLVTGISTGALIAPFAFLGPEYDAKLKEVYTTISADDVFLERGVVGGFFGDALADSKPLFDLVGRYANQDMLDAIAQEYARGRILLIATTNLDARQPVVWNIGEIAASGDPKALELFHKVLVASASIPGAFPPVMVDVEVDGTPYQEMHVDGGTMAQAFLYPPALDVVELSEGQEAQRERHVYIIRNARLDPDWASVERQTLSIVGRSVASLIHTQGIGDLYRMYLQTEKDGVDYNLAFIPPDFTAVHKEEFDTEFMRQLFDHAYEMSIKGYQWQKYPPGYSDSE